MRPKEKPPSSRIRRTGHDPQPVELHPGGIFLRWQFFQWFFLVSVLGGGGTELGNVLHPEAPPAPVEQPARER